MTQKKFIHLFNAKFGTNYHPSYVSKIETFKIKKRTIDIKNFYWQEKKPLTTDYSFMMELAKEYPTVLSNARSSFTQEAVQYLDELANPSYQKQVSTSSHCHFIGLPSSQ